MRDIRWLEPARESFLGMVEKLAETDIAEAAALLDGMAESLPGLVDGAPAFADPDRDATLKEIAVKPYCHLLCDVTGTTITVVAALPSRQWWELGDFLH